MDLTKFLVTLLLVCLLTSESYVDAASEEQDFLRSCPSHHCSKHGPEIRFPFRLSTNPPSCGSPGMQLSCSGDDTILDHPVLGSCKVTAIYYKRRVINVVPLVDPSMQCPLQKLISTSLETDVYKQPRAYTTLVRCSSNFVPADPYNIAGSASCLSNNASQFWYLASYGASITDLPRDCTAVSKDIPIPYTWNKHGNSDDYTFKEKANTVLNFGETTFTWHNTTITDACQQCEHEGRQCGFSTQRRKAFCMHHGIVFSS